MKTRIAVVVTASLAILVALLTFLLHNQEPAQVFPATAHRDCAPWDGAAFTVEIPINDATWISVSIWQEPDITRPRTFSFPDETGQVGNASLFHADGQPALLSGTVSFSPVQGTNDVQGEFDLKDETGHALRGRFHAEWQDQIIFCG